MMRMNPNLYPHDGYYYKESDGSRIFGDSWNGVISRVIHYRQRAGLPPGDPATEVIAQACARNPGYCSEVNPQYTEQLKAASLKTKVLKWMNQLRAQTDDKPRMVDWATVHERADICAKCPKNTPIGGGCSSCSAALKELRVANIGDRPIDGRLNACLVLGEDVVVSGYYDLQTVENGELPPECWRKRTL